MKILMLTPYLPYPLFSGGQIRTYNLLKNLSKTHDITLFSLIKEESERQYVQELEKYCTKVRVFRRSKTPFTLRNVLRAGFSLSPFLVIRNFVDEVIHAVKKELQSEHYDLIHAETFYMMPNIPRTDTPVLLVEQTIEYLGYLSYAKSTRFWPVKPLLYIDIFKIRYWEEYFWRVCARLVVMSDNDRQFMLRTTKNPLPKIDVVENGVDVEYFKQTRKHLPKEPTVLFVGTFKWLPNIEAVKFLIEEIWPLIHAKSPTAKLHIVGNSPTADVLQMAQQNPDITISGNIDDIRDAYAGAHVLLAPVFSGKGTRYKVLEALATGTPVVGTKLAVEGIKIEPGVHALIANTAQGLADETVKVLRDTALRERLAANGEKLVFQQYGWDKISKKLDAIYSQLGERG
ncbi:MAG TPA: glycosyltransferase family 4 protein [Candidatus Saccharimonadia bacterium]|nr:glycosyltransferase family 4 protein [Candidatus Saccharimonadia bacterium]